MNNLHGKGQLLAQVRPGVTSAVELFKAAELPVEVTLIMAAIVDSALANTTVEMFHDDSGSDTWDATTMVLVKQLDRTAGMVLFQATHAGSGIMLNANGSLGVAVGDANDVVLSVYGVTEDRAQQVVRT